MALVRESDTIPQEHVTNLVIALIKLGVCYTTPHIEDNKEVVSDFHTSYVKYYDLYHKYPAHILIDDYPRPIRNGKIGMVRLILQPGKTEFMNAEVEYLQNILRIMIRNVWGMNPHE